MILIMQSKHFKTCAVKSNARFFFKKKRNMTLYLYSRSENKKKNNKSKSKIYMTPE